MEEGEALNQQTTAMITHRSHAMSVHKYLCLKCWQCPTSL